MMEKKQKSEWLIAAQHFVIGGILIPFAATLAVVIIFVIISAVSPEVKKIFEIIKNSSSSLGYVPIILLNAVVLWLGIYASAKDINRRYVINDKKKIANISILYLFALSIAAMAYNYVANKDTNLGLPTTNLILSLAVFYYASNRYLQAK